MHTETCTGSQKSLTRGHVSDMTACNSSNYMHTCIQMCLYKKVNQQIYIFSYNYTLGRGISGLISFMSVNHVAKAQEAEELSQQEEAMRDSTC